MGIKHHLGHHEPRVQVTVYFVSEDRLAMQICDTLSGSRRLFEHYSGKAEMFLGHRMINNIFLNGILLNS